MNKQEIKDIVKGDDLTKLKDAMRYLIYNKYPTFKGQSKNSKLIGDYAREHDINHQQLSDFLMESIKL